VQKKKRIFRKGGRSARTRGGEKRGREPPDEQNVKRMKYDYEPGVYSDDEIKSVLKAGLKIFLRNYYPSYRHMTSNYVYMTKTEFLDALNELKTGNYEYDDLSKLGFSEAIDRIREEDDQGIREEDDQYHTEVTFARLVLQINQHTHIKVLFNTICDEADKYFGPENITFFRKPKIYQINRTVNDIVEILYPN
jgi:hypothetical protein